MIGACGALILCGAEFEDLTECFSRFLEWSLDFAGGFAGG